MTPVPTKMGRQRVVANEEPLLRSLSGILKVILALWLLMIGLSILLPYPTYFPPQFEKGFLEGRQAYFYSIYAVGFYAHIVSAPLVLVTGILQCSRTLRNRAIKWHKRLGTLYVWLILLAMAPGGLILGVWAIGGLVSQVAFVLLSLLTWWFTFCGWLAARRFHFREHGQWMCRSFLLVCSAVILRVLSLEASHWQLSAEWSYPCIAWLSWLPGWLGYELSLAACASRINQEPGVTEK